MTTAGGGRFITFEGGEGSGKSTQLKRLAAHLAARGLDALETREPGGSPMGERIRAILLDPAERPDSITQIFLFCASRRDHVASLIAPTLAAGRWVICDRFMDSTRAYQGAAGDVPAELLAAMEGAAVGATRPDLTIILDIDPARGLARARKRRGGAGEADTFEASDLAFHRRVREGYRRIAEAEPERCAVVDADRDEAAIAAEIAALCDARLGTEAGRG